MYRKKKERPPALSLSCSSFLCVGFPFHVSSAPSPSATKTIIYTPPRLTLSVFFLLFFKHKNAINDSLSSRTKRFPSPIRQTNVFFSLSLSFLFSSCWPCLCIRYELCVYTANRKGVDVHHIRANHFFQHGVHSI